MKKRFAIGIVSSALSLVILGIGLNAVGFANDTPTEKHITGLPAPHAVPPQLQGRPAQLNPDPGIDSPYSSNAKDTGFASAMKPAQKLDKGMTEQYPSFQPPKVEPATLDHTTSSMKTVSWGWIVFSSTSTKPQYYVIYSKKVIRPVTKELWNFRFDATHQGPAGWGTNNKDATKIYEIQGVPISTAVAVQLEDGSLVMAGTQH